MLRTILYMVAAMLALWIAGEIGLSRVESALRERCINSGAEPADCAARFAR